MMGGEGFGGDVEVEEYFEGRVTESGRASTEINDMTNKYDNDFISSSDREAVVKMS